MLQVRYEKDKFSEYIVKLTIEMDPVLEQIDVLQSSRVESVGV
jgi:hypothetical protein